MKKTLSILAALALSASLTAALSACGQTNPPQESTPAASQAQSEASQTESAPEETESLPIMVEPAQRELELLLEEMNDTADPGTAGSSLRAIKAACSLMNWSVGTTLTEDVIEETTDFWIRSKTADEQAAWKEKAQSIDAAYKELLSASEQEAKELLDEAGCLEIAAYPWGDGEPLFPAEALMKASGLRS